MKKTIFLLCLVLFFPSLRGQSTFVLSPNEEIWQLGKEVGILPDTSGTLTFEQVSQAYGPCFRPISQVKSG